MLIFYCVETKVVILKLYTYFSNKLYSKTNFVIQKWIEQKNIKQLNMRNLCVAITVFMVIINNHHYCTEAGVIRVSRRHVLFLFLFYFIYKYYDVSFIVYRGVNSFQMYRIKFSYYTIRKFWILLRCFASIVQS